MVPDLEVEEPEYGSPEWHAKYDVTCAGSISIKLGTIFNKEDSNG